MESAVVDDKYCFERETLFTVHKTSIFVPGAGDGFIVYDPAGDIIFRFDSYVPDSDELELMDSSGKPLLTLLRKKLSLHQRWEGFLGDQTLENQELVPIFSIFKSSIIGQFNVVAVVHGRGRDREEDKEYHVEGPFAHRCCCIYDARTNSEAKEVVAEVKRKVDPDRNVMLGKDVFLLCVKPLVDAAFMMAVLMILDRILGGDVVDDDEDGTQDHEYGLENDISS